MSDGVKFIFKTLLKVPIIIVVSFFIFNMFAFGLTYFKMLGMSYVVMTVAVENNYLPETELNTLNNYLNGITHGADGSLIGIIDNAHIITKGSDGYDDATIRRQYGQPVTVGVTCHYRFIWPLTPKEQLQNEDDKFNGYNGSGFSGFASTSELEDRRQAIENNSKNNIKITYTVPGLKYYPDMD